MEGKYKVMEQNFNPGLALIGLSGIRPRVLQMTEGLHLGVVPTSKISCRSNKYL